MTRPSRPNRAALGVRAALLLSIIVAWYCGGSPAGPDPTPEPPPPAVPLPAATVEVAPGSVVLRSLGDTETLAATVRSRDGAVLPNTSVDWASSDPTVASVDAGTVTALSNGEASVTATSGAASGSAAVRVEQVAARLNVVPRDVSFAAIGDTARLSATAYDGNDHEVTDATVEWSSTYPDVAAVSDDGLVTAVSTGAAEIVAASGAAVDTVAVSVVQAGSSLDVEPASLSFAATGDTARLSATVYDANGREVAGATVEWSSSDSDVATVSDRGLVTAVSDGTAEIVAAAGAARDTVAVNVDSTDRGILAAFYHAAGGPSWRHSDNWLTDAPLTLSCLSSERWRGEHAVDFACQIAL